MLLSLNRSLATKYVSLNNEPCLTRLTPIDLNLNELHFYSFMVGLYRCNKSCYTLDDLSSRMCVPKNLNLNFLNMITKRTES